jgi:RNA polymerase sigma-70 factor (ECF subfamily)
MTNTVEFEEFMQNHQDMVYSTAMRILGNPTDAADISQEVFLKAFEHYNELSASARRSGWLKTVTTNLCLNHLSRYRSRWKFFSEFFSGGGEDEEFSATLPAPEPDGLPADAAAQQRVLEAALLQLPSAQRVPLVLHHFEEMSYEEIARQLDISLGKVKTDIRRGRETLRKKLKLSPEGELTPGFIPPATPAASKRTLIGCV